MAYSKAKFKAMAIKYLLVSDHPEKEVHPQIYTYVDFTIGFI
jgi:hypothetical protein